MKRYQLDDSTEVVLFEDILGVVVYLDAFAAVNEQGEEQ